MTVRSRFKSSLQYAFRLYRFLLAQTVYLVVQTASLLPRGSFILSDLTAFLQDRKSTVETDVGSLLLVNNSWVTNLRVKNFSTAEPETLEWIKSFDAQSVFWDIGANVGVYSLYAAMSRHRVVAIEPSPWNLEALTKNIILNNFDRDITLIPIAVSQETTCTNFYMSREYQTSGGAHNSIGSSVDQFGVLVSDRDSLQVITTTVDSLITMFSLPKPNHIKIDVDGLELEVLQGAGEALETVQTLLVESFPSHPKRESLFKFLEGNGFFLESHSTLTSNSIWRNQKKVVS